MGDNLTKEKNIDEIMESYKKVSLYDQGRIRGYVDCLLDQRQRCELCGNKNQNETMSRIEREVKAILEKLNQ